MSGRPSARAVLISAVPPLMAETDSNPGGLSQSVFDDIQAQMAANRSQFFWDFAAGPFCNYNKPGVDSSQAVITNWWRRAASDPRQLTAFRA